MERSVIGLRPQIGKARTDLPWSSNFFIVEKSGAIPKFSFVYRRPHSIGSENRPTKRHLLEQTAVKMYPDVRYLQLCNYLYVSVRKIFLTVCGLFFRISERTSE
jgi:hypothetical protein